MFRHVVNGVIGVVCCKVCFKIRLFVKVVFVFHFFQFISYSYEHEEYTNYSYALKL